MRQPTSREWSTSSSPARRRPLEVLPPGGQLLLPLTGERQWGQTLLVTRRDNAEVFAARLVGYVGIYEFAGVRDAQSAVRLDAAIRRGDTASVRSLRRDAHAEEESYWLHAADFCLSRLPP